MQKLDKELLIKARENNELLTKAYDIISQSAKALAEIKYENGHNALVCLLAEITAEMEKNALAVLREAIRPSQAAG